MSSIPDWLQHFEYPCCYEYILPPIWQCKQGHLICTSCKNKVLSCPTCRGTLDTIRCLALEKISESLQFPCKYDCDKMLHTSEKLQHEDECQLHPFNCPMDGYNNCQNWKGDRNAVVKHLLSHHTVNQRIYYKYGFVLRHQPDPVRSCVLCPQDGL